MKSNMHKYLGIASALIVLGIFFLFLGFGQNFSEPIVEVVEDGSQLASVVGSLDTARVDSETGIITEDIIEGKGDTTGEGDTLTVHYVGLLEDGTVFDTSRNGSPFKFTIGAGQVISGWDNGLLGMKVGGKRVIVLPPEQAYGEGGVPGVIPANAVLIFEVELVSVQKAS